MTSQEKDTAKLILMVNAVKLVMLNQELEPHLRVSRAEMMQCIPVMASKSVRALCVGNVVAYYTHSEAPSNNAKTLYPDEYVQVEAEIIGNLRVQNFLSALAEGYALTGDTTVIQRLRNANAYIQDSVEKNTILREMGITRN